MDKITETLKGAIGGLFTLLTSIIGLLVLASVVFGEKAGMNVFSNNGFVGPESILAGLITLVLIVGLLMKQNEKK